MNYVAEEVSFPRTEYFKKESTTFEYSYVKGITFFQLLYLL